MILLWGSLLECIHPLSTFTIQQLALGLLVKPARQPGKAPLDPVVHGSGPGNIRTCLQTPSCHEWGWRCRRHLVGRARDAPQNPTTHGTAPRAKNDLTPSARIAQVDSPGLENEVFSSSQCEESTHKSNNSVLLVVHHNPYFPQT